ncbi:MAG: hypothetical protein D6698_13775, partial [Gammaproteobacteria bacterium]
VIMKKLPLKEEFIDTLVKYATDDSIENYLNFASRRRNRPFIKAVAKYLKKYSRDRILDRLKIEDI